MRKKGCFAVETEIKVPFFDVDSLNIVWHGNYVKYLEVARCALLDALDYNYITMKQCGYMWPVIAVELKYVKPAIFGADLIVRAELVEWETRLKVNYTIFDKASGERLTRASTTQVAVDLITHEMQFTTPESWQSAVRKVINL
ncbi:acyl-CoA thioester hydrolase [Cricetibacter osteomyelitidis]|uniref:Acyl-CoA thioester hydrolase n=1 Tax=Cricetibacter osteomyelitidis TaxID=1521931 RepID=A0A4R2SWN2_9PAST|nr:acyl-CoA thioesterase [Cricetibacter osteomyelitidis]TCP94899.1 acyl-CoA thioester hydrolase [Cricetibacter osteomyelitidis]